MIMRNFLLQVLLLALTVLFTTGCSVGDKEEIRYLNISFEVWDCRKDPPSKVTPENDPLFPVVRKFDLKKYEEKK